METTEIYLANAFIAVLNEWIPEHMEEVRSRNAANNDNCCATHDFCDANMAMDEAFQKVMCREFVFWNDEIPETQKQNESDTDLINSAWDIAKAKEYR